MAAKIPPSVLPDISPSRGESRTNFALHFASPTVEIKRKARSLSISPLVREMSGRTEAGKHHALRGRNHAR
ncbi:hypothetical protein BS627_10815 [Agrobacterium salinitolerans]|nr:hypothetical protein BS627_10815 [Agrobacterium salinitolerans]PNQ23732.1 hypothetical protein C2E26_11040 [Rhizobium sp. YIC5082]